MTAQGAVDIAGGRGLDDAQGGDEFGREISILLQ